MTEDTSSWMILLRTVGSLALVLGVIFGLSFIVKKYLRPERWAPDRGRGMKILHSFSLDPKKKLMIVEVESQRLLLGVTDHSISLVTQLSSQGAADHQEVRHAVL